jgi:AcrR family transcriptional regulator
MRIRTEETRRVIAQAALSTFCRRGYGVATLEEIGAEVGLTRGAVLHHFNSKADLLGAVIDPYRRALAELLLTIQVDDPPTVRQRRQLLTRFADLFLEHRGALRLLANDVTARVQLGLGDQWPMPQGRLLTLLVGSKATDLTHVRVTAAIGAMIQPLASVWHDLDDPTTRGELIDAAVAVIDGPRSTSSQSRRDVAALSSTVNLVPLPAVATQ